MLTRRITYITLVFFAAVSCKKASDYVYDAEANVSLDTATFLKSATYISHTATQLTVQIEMATINGLASETDYTGIVVNDTVIDAGEDPVAGVTFSFGPSTNAVLPSATEHSTVFLMNTYNPWWYNYYTMTPHLQRYFQNAETSPFGRYALTKLDKLQSGQLVWLTENGTDHFDNTWQHSISEIMSATTSDGVITHAPTSVSLDQLAVSIEEISQEVGGTAEFIGARSITIFTDDDFNVSTWNSVNQNDVDTMIYEAQTNNFQINFIGPRFNYLMSMIACQTGGFMFEGANAEGNPDIEDYVESNPLRDLGVAGVNLHDILLNSLTVNRFTMTIDGPTFVSGGYKWFTFLYEGEEYEIAIKIP